jgi:cytochrome o ubiquinol oxidase subunit 2
LKEIRVNKKIQFFLVLLFIVGAVSIAIILLHGHDIPVLNPQGTIANKERDLIMFTVILALAIIIPVFVMLFAIVWKYREGNIKANTKYSPDWDGSRLYETIWWGVPCIVMLILGVIIWQSSHELDPYKKLASNVKPIQVQVVALQWKWLFIYPEQKVASVNFVQFPEDTPVNFEITADAPMNSFWIPSLGGQVYAMTGMTTKLHLQADNIGSYNGSSANISGEGFAGMKFVAKATSKTDFDNWIRSNQSNTKGLNMAEYDKLATPSKDVPASVYSLKQSDLYDTIVMKYMAHGSENEPMNHEHMNMEMH